MTWTPTPEHWSRYTELVNQGVDLADDDLEFTLGVIRRYDPQKNKSIKSFYLWCRANSRNATLFRDNQLPTTTERPEPYDTIKLFDAISDASAVKQAVGQAGYAVLQLRYGEGLSVAQTSKRLGMSRESVSWIEKEALARASSLKCDD